MNEDRVRAELDEMFANTSEQNKIHWPELTKQFVDTKKCSNETLISIMNQMLMPFGNLMGMDHRFWRVAR